jgi:hypothetical protein
MLFKFVKYMYALILWFIISIFLNMFFANVFVPTIKKIKKHFFHNKNVVLLEHLEFFFIICINMFWFICLFKFAMMFNIIYLFDIF